VISLNCCADSDMSIASTDEKVVSSIPLKDRAIKIFKETMSKLVNTKADPEEAKKNVFDPKYPYKHFLETSFHRSMWVVDVVRTINEAPFWISAYSCYHNWWRGDKTVSGIALGFPISSTNCTVEDTILEACVSNIESKFKTFEHKGTEVLLVPPKNLMFDPSFGPGSKMPYYGTIVLSDDNQVLDRWWRHFLSDQPDWNENTCAIHAEWLVDDRIGYKLGKTYIHVYDRKQMALLVPPSIISQLATSPLDLGKISSV